MPYHIIITLDYRHLSAAKMQSGRGSCSYNKVSTRLNGLAKFVFTRVIPRADILK
jgi:hypothetical protein